MLDELLADRVYLDPYRGRSCYSFAVQAAERAVRLDTGLLGLDDLGLVAAHRRDDGAWTVAISARGRGIEEVDLREEARGARPPHLRRGDAQAPRPLRRHGPASASGRLIRRKPSRTRRRMSTSRPGSSSRPGRSAAVNGASTSAEKADLLAEARRQQQTLAVEDERERVAVLLDGCERASAGARPRVER